MDTNEMTEMRFLRRMAGLSLRDRARSSDVRREIRVEPLLLGVERSQLRRFGHLIRMPFLKFQARPSGQRPLGRPRTGWRDWISLLAWEHLWVPQEELESFAGEKEAWKKS